MSPDSPSPWVRYRQYTVAVTYGLLYGIALRLLMDSKHPSDRALLDFGMMAMSIGFLFVGPFVAGYLCIAAIPSDGRSHWPQWIFLPWLSVLLAYAVLFAIAWEGAICLVFASPACVVCASLGGITAGILVRSRFRQMRSTTFCLLLLPFALSALESRFNGPMEIRTVETQIVIHASAQTVWQKIERVPPIAHAEITPTWTHAIGFPLPVEATLDHEGVGGVRHASFEHGLTFIETINAWDPGKRIAFSIATDTAAIPATTLDEHATIGGRYFDVLNGEYRLEPLPDGDILLHLSSSSGSPRTSTYTPRYGPPPSCAIFKTASWK